jgi:hypothetical protein
MGAFVEEFVEMSCSFRDRSRVGDTDAIESKRARFSGECCL